MLQLVSISKQYGDYPLFEDLSWTILPGTRVGLVGPNGAGKTTLFRVIVGQEPTDGGEVARNKGVTVGYLPQEGTGDVGEGTVLKVVTAVKGELLAMEEEMRRLELLLSQTSADSPDYEGVASRYGHIQQRFEDGGGFLVHAQAREILLGLGFTHSDLQRSISELSGGFRMRVLLARHLLVKPDVLLLDEPTNHLDMEALDWLEGFLQEYDSALVVISHDRYFLNRTVTQIADLRDGRLTQYKGNYDYYLKQSAENQERMGSQLEGLDRKIEATERFVNRFKAKASKASQAQSRAKLLDRLKEERQQLVSGGSPTTNNKRAMRLVLPPAQRCGREVVALEKVSKSYGHLNIYRSLSLHLYRGERMALVGPNGAGKSTLLKLMAGVLEFESGDRRVGHNVKLNYYAQHALDLLDGTRSVLAEAESVADMDSMPTVRSILGAFGLGGKEVEKRVAVLSGGEKSRLALARMLISPGNCLLLDEPTNHLDMESREALEKAFTDYQGCMVFISHDRYFINAVANVVVEIEPGGRINRYPGDFDSYQRLKARQKEVARLSEEAESGQGGNGQGRLPSNGTGFSGEADGAKGRPKEDEKERKRRQAEERNRLHRATATLKARLAKVEDLVAGTESRMEEVRALQIDSDTYNNPDLIRQLATEGAELESKLEGLMEEWEELESQLQQAAQSATG